MVDNMGKKLNEARQKKNYASTVPDEALDACEESYHAAKGDSEGHSSEKFDSNGVMAVVCRHDIPILFINVDTPGNDKLVASLFTNQLVQESNKNMCGLQLFTSFRRYRSMQMLYGSMTLVV
jgi:hypothetical protein